MKLKSIISIIILTCICITMIDTNTAFAAELNNDMSEMIIKNEETNEEETENEDEDEDINLILQQDNTSTNQEENIELETNTNNSNENNTEYDSSSDNNIPITYDNDKEYAEPEWKNVDISHLLYSTGAFPKYNAFDFSGLPEIDIFDKLANVDEFSSLIYDAIKNKTNLSDISKYQLTENQISTRIATVINQTPEFFYANTSYQYYRDENENIIQIILFPDKIFESNTSIIQPFISTKRNTTTIDKQEKEQILENRANEIISQINPDWNDEQIALYLHNWLVLNCEYDYENSTDKGNAYGAIINGKAVCIGYARAYQYLLEKINIPCSLIGSDTLNHAWNLININGQNYHVDVTWDDTTNNYICRYNCFLKSQNYIYNYQHGSTDWIIIPSYSNAYDTVPTSTDHDDYYWNDALTPIIQKNNKAIYWARQSKMSIHDYNNNTDIPLNCIDIPDQLVYCGLIDNNLIAGYKNTIYLIDIENNKIINQYNIPETEKTYGDIYWITVNNGIIQYTLLKDMYDQNEPYIGTLDWSEYRNTAPVTITFETNGGTPIENQIVQYGDKVTRPKDPTKENFVFDNWYADQECTRLYNFDYTVTNSFTIYAKWVGPHTVKFNTNGGNDIAPITVQHNQTIPKPKNPKKDGYKFLGWYIYNGSVYDPYDFTTPVTNDITLYAMWKENSAYGNTTFVNGQTVNIKSLYFDDLEKIAKYRTILTETEANASKYATISTKGILTTKKAGKITIIPQYKSGKKYYDFDDEQVDIEIIPKPTLKFAKPLTYEGQTINIYDCFANNWKDYGFTAINLTSSKDSIASIDNDGTITAGYPGKNNTVTITAYFSNKGEDYATNTVKVSAKLTVKIPSFKTSVLNLKTGQSIVLAMNNVSAVTNPTWQSSNEDAVTVVPQYSKKKLTGKAIIKAIKYGDYTLTATIDGQDYTCEIHIIEPSIKKTAIKIKKGKTNTVALKNTSYAAKSVQWYSENPAMATVASGGKVKGIDKGTTIIYTETGGIRNECEVTIY